MSSIEEFFKTPLRQEFGKRLEKIMVLLEEAQSVEDPLQRKKDEGNYRRMLDKLYWELFEAICNDVVERDDVSYHVAEMIILNYGLLDHRQLVAPAPKKVKNEDGEEILEEQEIPDLETIEKRIKKFFVKSSYDEDPIYYMSEWAAMWQVSSELFLNAKQSPAQAEEEWLDDEKAHKYSNTRSNIYRKLHTYLEKLPGVNDNFLKILISGDFDRKVELVKVKTHLQPEGISQTDKHLTSIHSTLYSQLKASLKDSEDLKLVFLLEKINEAIFQRRLKEEQVEQEEEVEQKNESHEQVIAREVKLLKNQLPIGGMEGREFFTTPLLKEFTNPLNKVFVGDTMKLIRQCDPHIPEDLPVVIVPYKGSGFFEWDKNSLIVPVTPSLPPKEVIIRAVANYRILTDNLEHKGELKRQYERHLEKGGFKERFLHDYTQWIEHISQGHRKIMSVKKFDFFVEYVGPDRNKLLAEGNLQYLSKYQLRKKIQEMLTNAKMSQKDYYNLAVSYWMVEEYKKADQYMTEAMTAGMPSPKILLAQGYIAQKILEKARAKQMFKNCLRFFKNSLYGAYAARELEKN